MLPLTSLSNAGNVSARTFLVPKWHFKWFLPHRKMLNESQGLTLQNLLTLQTPHLAMIACPPSLTERVSTETYPRPQIWWRMAELLLMFFFPAEIYLDKQQCQCLSWAKTAMPSLLMYKVEKHHRSMKKKWCVYEVQGTKHQFEPHRCLRCGEALKFGRAEANQSWQTYASRVFSIVGFISMPLRSSVALITGSVPWGWGPEAMLKDQNPLQDLIISRHISAAMLLALI